MFCRPQHEPFVSQDIEAAACWMSETRTLTSQSQLLVRRPTRTVEAIVHDRQSRAAGMITDALTTHLPFWRVPVRPCLRSREAPADGRERS